MITHSQTYDKRWFLKNSKLYYEEESNICLAENSSELDLSNPKDMCIGVIGDGCGGGRIFIADTGHNMIKVYDPTTAEVFIILKDIDQPTGIKKKGCILSIEIANTKELIEFDLSSMKQIIKSL